jgi:hypothetical protein
MTNDQSTLCSAIASSTGGSSSSPVDVEKPRRRYTTNNPNNPNNPSSPNYANNANGSNRNNFNRDRDRSNINRPRFNNGGNNGYNGSNSNNNSNNGSNNNNGAFRGSVLRLQTPFKLQRLVEQVAQTEEERQDSLDAFEAREISNANRRRPAASSDPASSAPYRDDGDKKGGAKATGFVDGESQLVDLMPIVCRRAFVFRVMLCCVVLCCVVM